MRHWMTRDVLHAAPDEPIAEVRLWMDARGFSLVPLREEPVERYVCREDLDGAEGALASVARPIALPHLVEADLSLDAALPRLATHGWFFVLEGDRVVGIITRADLRRPAVRLHTLAHLLVLEEGLDTLLRSYGAYRSVARRSFVHVVQDTVACPPLLADLGLDRDAASDVLHNLRRLRNHLAHGRSLLDHTLELPDAVAEAARAAKLCARVWQLIDDRDQIWQAYAQASLSGQGDGLPASAVVITAYNPGDEVLPSEQNARRDRALGAILTARGLPFVRSVARAPGGDFEEPGFAVEGLDRFRALELAQRFGQRAIYELTPEEIRVIDMQGRARRTVSRG